MKKLIESKLANAKADLLNTINEIIETKKHSNLSEKLNNLLNKEQQLIGAIDTYTDLLNCKEIEENEILKNGIKSLNINDELETIMIGYGSNYSYLCSKIECEKKYTKIKAMLEVVNNE